MDAFWPVKRRKCLQPDVGPGPGTLSCGVLATYLDDILVYSMDTWDNLKHLKSTVEAHTKAGIKIQPKKTKIFQTETEYLGHKVSQGRVQMLDQYVKDIQSLPRPTSCKEMSSFLGFTGY